MRAIEVVVVGLLVLSVAARLEVCFQPAEAWERVGRNRTRWMVVLLVGVAWPMLGVPAALVYVLFVRNRVRGALRQSD